jgi:hypothetical protein
MSTPQIPTINITIRQFATRFQYSMIALVLMGVCPLRALAQDGHSHTQTPQHHEMTQDQQSKASALLKIVRESTERFKDVSVAEAEGYALQFGCVSGDSAGAMGLHFINGDLVNQRRIGRHTSPNRDLRGDAERTPATHRRRLSAFPGCVGCEESGSAPAHGTGLSFVRRPESIRAPGVLYAACLGVEGESQRRVCELAPQRFVRGIRPPEPLSRGDRRT